MSLILMESFDDGMWNLGKWDSYNATTLVAGRTGNALQLLELISNRLVKGFPAVDTLVCGRAFKNTAWNSSTSNKCLTMLSNGGTQTEIQMSVLMGTITMYRNAVQIATSAPGIILTDTWYYIECKATLHDSTGNVQVRVDGVEVINFTGDTKASTFTQFDQIWFGQDRNVTAYIDDVYVLDGTGSVNNDFLGDITVEALPVNGNGNSSVLVGSDADSTDNYLLVDENPPSSADYVGSVTQGDKDTYAVTNLTGTPSAIHGMAINSYVAKSDTGLKFARPVLRSGTTDYVGTSEALSTSYVARQGLWELDPDTGPAAWTESGINAAQIGFEVRNTA